MGQERIAPAANDMKAASCNQGREYAVVQTANPRRWSVLE